MTVAIYLLNKMANAAVADDFTARAHTGDPGNGGAANRIAGAPTAALLAGEWSDASGGDVQYDNDLAFGVLDSGNARIVTWLSLYQGVNWAGNIEMDAAVAVAAGGTLSVNTGTINLDGMSA